jgi:hypothetical protein
VFGVVLFDAVVDEEYDHYHHLVEARILMSLWLYTSAIKDLSNKLFIESDLYDCKYKKKEMLSMLTNILSSHRLGNYQ